MPARGGHRPVLTTNADHTSFLPAFRAMKFRFSLIPSAVFLSLWTVVSGHLYAAENDTVRVFIFAGQSNMVGSDSKVQDIANFPPFSGLENPQPDVRFSYCIGREHKHQSDGWVPLQPVDNVVGPELSFAREVTKSIPGPIAIIKIAAGGTHLGGDWNPDDPSGFKMYPLALQWIRDSLQKLRDEGHQVRIEAFMWHQGENDMFEPNYMENYGKNLKSFIASWRRDLQTPDLPFYIGELCTKTIWGMDLRPRMYAISLGQKAVTNEDPRAYYVPTSHIGVEIGGGAGLHYHYGTLGQLEHGVNYANAYLTHIKGVEPSMRRLTQWPYPDGESIKLFILAGHRNMEGERAFIQNLATLPGQSNLLKDDSSIAFRYNIGGGCRVSESWEPLGPAGFYDTFGPELSFGKTLRDSGISNIAIAKFTHSGSQIIDWTPEGSEAESRNLYPAFIEFIRSTIEDLEAKGHRVDLQGIFYHVGENDMSWGPFRRGAADRVMALITQSRTDLALPNLKWYISQQPPTDDPSVNSIDAAQLMVDAVSQDPNAILIQDLKLPPQSKKLVLDTAGVIALGKAIANRYLEGQE